MISPYILPGIRKVISNTPYNADKMKSIEEYMVKEFNLPEDFIKNKCRKREKYIIPRGVYFYTCCKIEGIKESLIEEITGKDRTTVIHSCRTIENLLKYNEEFLRPYIAMLKK